MLLSTRQIHEHNTYSFGESGSLMVTEFFEGMGIEDYPTKYEMGAGTLYRGDNLVDKPGITKKPGIKKKQDVHVIEVFHSLKKQILWIWSRDVDGFQGGELGKVKEVNETVESQRLYRIWENTWVEIANAQEGEVGAAISKITNMGLKVQEMPTKENKEKGIKLRVVFLEDITDPRLLGHVYSN
ncbi:hypothetical protein A0O28_0070710 [Trichoderma guizhouense]|uniref:Uncharacterized protein n=1 Tax=Trichoderma guizhouense TaxID=1491466 RepID=A0A1T3D0Y0_9HYPO|nr:hypothetical protein A0O28_0070710 [Trichoderma guizhouense]